MKILLAEDQVELNRAIQVILENSGYNVECVYNGEEAVIKAKDNIYDLFIFDIMMPIKDGLEALKDIRNTGNTTPAIFLTAKSEVDDRVDGLEAGADDYITKPFAMKELLARVKALLRRHDTYSNKIFEIGNVIFNSDNLELKSINSIRLSQKESELLQYMMSHFNKDITYEMIKEHIWDNEECNQDIVYMYISYLKNKLKAVGANIIIEINDTNYKLVMNND